MSPERKIADVVDELCGSLGDGRSREDMGGNTAKVIKTRLTSRTLDEILRDEEGPKVPYREDIPEE
ncbi:hypothetical protein KJ632_00080, partial [Patescibacteria group bacterium]|nr:hypothetical protein [Patescibacteria group bacterium]